MSDSIEKAIEKAIENLVERIDLKVGADDALKYTQAALNLANAEARLQQE